MYGSLGSDYSILNELSSNSASYSSVNSNAAIATALATIAGIGIFVWLILIALSILILVAKWKLFKKANIDGWEALIPIHADIVEMKLGGMKTYWYFLNLIAICGIGPLIVAFWKNIVLSKAFGKGAGFGVLMTFFPFVCYPILAFGSAQYVGNVTTNTINNSEE